MKLIAFKRKNQLNPEIGVLTEQGAVPAVRCGITYPDMNTLIEKATAHEMDYLNRMANERRTPLEAGSYALMSPIPYPKQDVICLGLNYKEHIEEAESYSSDAFELQKQNAVYFSKRASYCPGSGETVSSHSGLTEKLDYEAELAVIIGKEACQVPEEDVKDYIFGYTVLNDLTARDVQTSHAQWYFGKSLDGFCPMGPCIVTADEVSWPPVLKIRSYVNGELRQESDTGMLIHGIGEIIAELSQGMRLMPGTIIATGTPKGTGMGMNPPVFLKPGDTVVCEIEGIGRLENTIV
ncbi:MAG: fumarylacetoacetate hydrolase family protein [Erysipelotrichaceae bacterium]|nr:fumarylacetoacetate hydrolase family protein [Erysipelotrichaceae bacterium]